MRRLCPVVVLFLVVASCGGPKKAASTSSAVTNPTTSTPAISTTAGPSTMAGPSTTRAAATTTTATPSKGCATPAGTVPADVDATDITDVDGDGKADRGYFDEPASGGRRFVIVTSAGGRFETEIASASPAPAEALVVDADLRGPVEIIVSDNRTAYLFAFTGCAIGVVHNKEGQQYEFDLGFRGTGTGVGCVKTAAGRDLVGLNRLDSGPTTVRWRRTVITLSGTEARNGASTTGSFTPADDPVAIDLLGTISCGDLRIDDDGVLERE